jgi:hypothetical protein
MSISSSTSTSTRYSICYFINIRYISNMTGNISTTTATTGTIVITISTTAATAGNTKNK